ncbi:hypothetical protein [Ectopseudomonas mendocina]|uniref:hypothetical protein n=1 Tax=Ectopseudomonas mendocina TaxID=300 RepID=UPI0005A2DE0A|nr:hypothetical protein [Pseudomonas mendocina]
MHAHTKDEWIPVSQQELNKIDSREQRGVKVEYMISPTDLPIAWRVRPDKGMVHVVEFKYLTDGEPTKIETQQVGVKFELGKNSRRIYKIYLDFGLLSHEGELIINLTADSISHAHGLNPNNSKGIQRFFSLESSRPELMEQFAHRA